MNPAAGSFDDRWSWGRFLTPVLAAAVGALIALSGSGAGFALGIAGILIYALFTVVSLRQPLVFAAVFLLSLEMLPPFYFQESGETPVYVPLLLLPAALAIILIRCPDFHFRWDPVAIGLAMFLCGTAMSLPFAWWLSGVEAGIFSLSRWALLSQAALVYYLIRGGARLEASRTERQMFCLLLLGAVWSAVYGIADFLWPFPLPHPAADQFIWLEGVVLRRAQGVFYESSSFANFCGFFLIAASTALLARRERYLGAARSLLVCFISVLGLAILVAFSRSAWASVAAALAASMLLSRFLKMRRLVAALLALSVPLLLLWTISPELWDYFLSARLGRLIDIFDDPNLATSGRFETWVRVLSILRDHPQYLVFGIGYKTLPVTRLFGGEIITDNGYLSLLLETGIAGLAGFLILSAAILRTFFRLARTASDLPAFWATVLFSIWCGELVQLLAADAYTYWRNIVVFTALMALTLNIAERNELSEGAT